MYYRCNMHGHIVCMSGPDSNIRNLGKLVRRNYHNINRGLPENPDTMDDDIKED